MDGTGREWRLVGESAHDGPVNMALDAVAAETAADGGPRTVRVYRWEPSTVSLGYAQPAATVDWAFCEGADIPVTRRPTGGGGIYHDRLGDLSYAIALPAEEVPADLLESYGLLLEPVLDALGRMGVDAAVATEARPALHEPSCYLRGVDPAHDVVVDGRKLSGNAQYRRRDAVVQHGSITYARRTERHLDVFADPDVTPAEFEARVTSVRAEAGIDRPEAVEALESALAEWAGAEPAGWLDRERARAEVLVEERFGREEWTRRR